MRQRQFECLLMKLSVYIEVIYEIAKRVMYELHVWSSFSVKFSERLLTLLSTSNKVSDRD